jgi:4-amino-4-deoxy-L-arabinose transferase-like glycosyltransferase
MCYESEKNAVVNSGLFSPTMVLILLLAIGLRVWGLQGQSLTSDEVAEIEIAKGSLGEILPAKDGFPPLYHVFLWGWLKIFQHDESARWLSVLFGSITVLIMWKLGSEIGGKRAKCWIAFILAVSPFHIWYSQESRAYALYFLEATLVFWFFFKAFKTGHLRDWIFYGFFVLAGLYTHYFFSILVLVNCILFLKEMQTRRDLKKVFLLHVGIGFFTLPLLWLLKEDLELQTAYSYQTPFGLAEMGFTYFSYLSGYVLGPSIRELHTMPTLMAIIQFLPWLIILCACLVVFCYQALREQLNKVILKRLIITTFVPVLMCGLLSEVFDVGYKVQYVLWASIPVFMIIGMGISHNTHVWMTRISLIILCSVFAIALYNRHFEQRYQNENTRALANYIKSELSEGAPIFVTSDYMEKTVRYYLGDEWSTRPVPKVGRQGEGLDNALTLMNHETSDNAHYNLVYTREFHADPGGWFLKALRQMGTVNKQAEFAGITLYSGTIR